jgi:integrase
MNRVALYKRGAVYWTYVWVNGVRHAKSTSTGIRREAQRIDDQYKEELLLARTHPHRLKPDLTFGELSAFFLAEASPKVHHRDRLKVLLPYFADIPIGEISRATAREYRKYRHEKKKTVSETTVNRDLEVLRHLLFWAVDEGYIAANSLSRMPMARERRKPRVVMSLDEEARLLSQTASHLHSLVICALDTGMRQGELLTQGWEHIDFNRRLLSVTHSKTAEGESREIPLTNRVFEFLSANRRPKGLVFLFNGRSVYSVKTAWAAAIRRSGIRHYRFHDLRHTFNTRLMEAGVMQEVRKALMGHSSGEDVHAIYTHVELPAKREAICKLEVWVEAQRLAQAEKEKTNEQSSNTERSGPQPDVSESGSA